MSPLFRKSKIAFFISTALSIAMFSTVAGSTVLDINSTTTAEDRVVNISSGSDVSYIKIRVADGQVTMADNSTVTHVVTATSLAQTSAFAYISNGVLDLGKGFTINYDAGNSTETPNDAFVLGGTGILKAENLSVNGENQHGIFSALEIYNASRVDLKGTTNLSFATIKTLDDSVLNAENVNITYNKPSGINVDYELMELTGKESNFTGNVNLTAHDASAIALVGIFARGNTAKFSGKTTINLAGSGDVSGVVIQDTTLPFGQGATGGYKYYTNNISFNELIINSKSTQPLIHTVSHVTGLDSQSQRGDTSLTINKLSIDVSGNNDVEGVLLRDTRTEGSAKYRINEANIKVSGGEKATMEGYYSDAEDVIIGNLNVQSEGGDQVFLMRQNTAINNFTGDVTLGSQLSYDSVSGTLYAIYGQFDGMTNIVNQNKLVAWGRMYSADGHTTNIITGDNSYLYGDSVIETDGAYNLALNGRNSQWDITDDSTVTNLTLKDSTLNFLSPAVQTRKLSRDAATFKTLTVNGDYKGNDGNIVMNTQLGDDASPTDKLVVQGNTSGTTNVKVVNAGGAGGLTTDGIELITVAGTSDGEFKQNGRIVAGAYDYTLARGEGSNEMNWYLSSAISPEDPVVPVDPSTPAKPQAPRESAIRPEAGLYGMNLQAANTLFNTRLQDRLGETHYVDALTGEKAVTSLWLRNVGGHTRQKDSSGQLEMQANRYVMQLGGDIAQWSSDNADRFHLGLMAGYANQKARAENQRNGNRADGSISGYSVGLYGTWLQDNETHEGAYVDTWAQYSWFNNSVNGRGVDEATKEYDAKGFTASVESG
uniref:autotransporter outer membrane beta-barrel domain-containing protein n=1 Tax=Citrobacter tructae TaxID=2562449 RepID=UPI003F54ABD3